MKQHPKQLTLQCVFGNKDYFTEAAVVRSKEEGELMAYIENVGHEPNNLPPEHPGYPLWTWRTRRDGVLSELLGLKT